MKINVKKLDENAIVPNYAHLDDAGCDLFSIENLTIQPGQRVQIKTGIAIEVPDGHVALLWDKSGLSQKFGLKTLGGVVDSGYRGEILVGIVNLGDETYNLEKGNKVCQMIIQPKIVADFIEVENLSDSERGEGGFGSTGK